MRKIAICITNRSSYGRLKSVMKAIQAHPKLQLQLIVTAAASGSFYDVILNDGFTPDATIHCLLADDNHTCMSTTTGLLTTQLALIFDQLKPDIIYLHGDRSEQMSIAIAASYSNRILCHSEGGESTSSIDDKVRNCISHLADYHFPVTDLAKQKLIQMGCDPAKIFVVGSTALDILKGINLANYRKEPYYVILQHPNTTDPEPLEPLIEAVKQIPMHPVWVNCNVDPGSRAMLKLIHQQNTEFIKDIPPEEYGRLIFNARCLVGNSSSFIKEAAWLATPAVLVGNRQDGREIGHNVMQVPNETDKIVEAVNIQMGRRYKSDLRFGNGDSSKKIADILADIKDPRIKEEEPEISIGKYPDNYEQLM